MVHAAAAFFLSMLITAQLCTASTSTDECSSKVKSKFPGVLVFGDSTVDTGNNNFIFTAFKGNHEPYGQDFPGRVPTGRFSNGKLVPDIMASIVGLKEAVPPFLDPSLSDKDIVTGVCFASAGSGLDDLTTTVSGVIPVSRQPDYFKNYIQRLQGIVGEKEAARILSKGVVIISAGTNDFIFNFYDLPTRRLQFTIHQYQDFLQSKLQDLIKVKTLPLSLFLLPPLSLMYLSSMIIMHVWTNFTEAV